MLMRSLLVFLCLALPAGAGEWVSFSSANPSGPSELMAGGATAVTIRGLLTLAAPHSGKAGAIVIMHGSGGILEGREGAWADRLGGFGLATFVVDSFGPRGIHATGDDQSRLPLAASIADALHAFRTLALRPDIDPTRIGIMGFSKGGQIALYTTLEPFRRAVLGPNERFALHIALYASCSIPYKSNVITGAPMLLLLGGADDYTPAAHCDRYVSWFRSKGAWVRKIVYSGAHHGFDMPELPRRLPRVQSARNCGLDIELEPVIGRHWDGTELPADQIPAYLRSCMQRGGTFGGDGEALGDAIEQIGKAAREYLARP